MSAINMVLLSPEGNRLCSIRVRRKELADRGIQHDSEEALAYVTRLMPVGYRLTGEAQSELKARLNRLLSWSKGSTFSLRMVRRPALRDVSRPAPGRDARTLREELNRSRRNQRDANRRIQRCLQEQERLRESLESSKELNNDLQDALHKMTDRVRDLNAQCDASAKQIGRLRQKLDAYEQKCIEMAEALRERGSAGAKDGGEPPDSPFL